MDNDRIETLLLKLLEDMAVVKSRLNSIEEIKLDNLSLEDKWILTKLNKTIKNNLFFNK